MYNQSRMERWMEHATTKAFAQQKIMSQQVGGGMAILLRTQRINNAFRAESYRSSFKNG
jgi:hypothetical protein